MRAAAILGLGCSAKNLKPFQSDANVEWRMGMPASRDDADAVVLFGGDGTIHRHLGSLVRLGLPVLVVPAGSGNDFACALGLRRVRDSLAAWKKFCAGAGNLRTIDLGTISQLENADAPNITQGIAGQHGPRYFCCVAGRWARRRSSPPRQPLAALVARAWRISAEPRSNDFHFRAVSDEDLHADRKRK